MTNEFNFDVKHEDYEEWLNQIEQVSDADCSLLSDPNPYTKCVCSPESSERCCCKDGCQRKYPRRQYFCILDTADHAPKGNWGGTVYTVTGYYEGKTDFLRKLERMTVDRMRRAMEDDIDDK